MGPKHTQLEGVMQRVKKPPPLLHKNHVRGEQEGLLYGHTYKVQSRHPCGAGRRCMTMCKGEEYKGVRKFWCTPSQMAGQLFPEVAACLRRAAESPDGHAQGRRYPSNPYSKVTVAPSHLNSEGDMILKTSVADIREGGKRSMCSQTP